MRLEFLLWLSRISRHSENPLYQRRNSFYAYILLNWGAAVLRPYIQIGNLTPAARLAADLAWPLERPF
jgi:hypothetical protein